MILSTCNDWWETNRTLGMGYLGRVQQGLEKPHIESVVFLEEWNHPAPTTWNQKLPEPSPSRVGKGALIGAGTFSWRVQAGLQKRFSAVVQSAVDCSSLSPRPSIFLCSFIEANGRDMREKRVKENEACHLSRGPYSNVEYQDYKLLYKVTMHLLFIF